MGSSRRPWGPRRIHSLIALVLALLCTLAWLALFRMTVTGLHLLLCWLLAVNVLAFVYYGYDKWRARQAGRRIPEVVLHGLAVAGGSLGAYLGMRTFRHKTIKGPFQLVFWAIVVLQGLLLGWLIWRLWWSRT